MVDAMVEGTNEEIQRWEHIVAEKGEMVEMNVEVDLHNISGRILSLTGFGGDFEKGEQVYKLQVQLTKEIFKVIRSAKSKFIPFFRYMCSPLEFIPYHVYHCSAKEIGIFQNIH